MTTCYTICLTFDLYGCTGLVDPRPTLTCSTPCGTCNKASPARPLLVLPPVVSNVDCLSGKFSGACCSMKDGACKEVSKSARQRLLLVSPSWIPGVTTEHFLVSGGISLGGACTASRSPLRCSPVLTMNSITLSSLFFRQLSMKSTEILTRKA